MDFWKIQSWSCLWAMVLFLHCNSIIRFFPHLYQSWSKYRSLPSTLNALVIHFFRYYLCPSFVRQWTNRSRHLQEILFYIAHCFTVSSLT
jgi:hypothetical protein